MPTKTPLSPRPPLRRWGYRMFPRQPIDSGVPIDPATVVGFCWNCARNEYVVKVVNTVSLPHPPSFLVSGPELAAVVLFYQVANCHQHVFKIWLTNAQNHTTYVHVYYIYVAHFSLVVPTFMCGHLQ